MPSSRDNMHPVAYIRELQMMICERAEPSALAALARTWTGFFYPAVQELYRHTTWRQLLHHIELFNYRSSRVLYTWDPISCHLRPPLGQEPQRFDIYAALVHHLNLGSWQEYVPEDNLFDVERVGALFLPEHLAEFRLWPKERTLNQMMNRLSLIALTSQWGTLFPNLRSLRIDADGYIPILRLIPVFYRTLDELRSLSVTLKVDNDFQEFIHMLQVLPRMAPGLQLLGIRGFFGSQREGDVDSEHDMFAHILPEVLQDLPALDNFVAGPACITPKVFGILRHSRLRYLTISLAGDRPFERLVNPRAYAVLGAEVSDEDRRLHFKALENLAFEKVPVARVGSFLRQIEPDRLESLSITTHSAETVNAGELSDLSRIIQQHEQLESFTLLLSRSEEGVWPFLKEIASSCDLRVLSIKARPYFEANPTDELFETLAKSCGNLRSLSLIWEYGCPDEEYFWPSIQSIVALRKHCPQLEYLRLSALRIKKTDLQSRIQDIEPRPLHLHLSGEIVEDLDDTAGFLVQLAAPLYVTRSRLPQDEGDYSLWPTIISKMSAVRRFMMLRGERPQNGALGTEDRYLGEEVEPEWCD